MQPLPAKATASISLLMAGQAALLCKTPLHYSNHILGKRRKIKADKSRNEEVDADKAKACRSRVIGEQAAASELRNAAPRESLQVLQPQSCVLQPWRACAHALMMMI
eukprot:355617-Chlamydomonas_euryale.AAC.15